MKPNCYECKWRESAGSYTCHSKCSHPFLDDKGKLLSMAGFYNPLNVKVNQHGFKNNWAFYPLDFDPIWIENCEGFEPIIPQEKGGEKHI